MSGEYTKTIEEMLSLYTVEDKDIYNIRQAGEKIIPNIDEYVSIFYMWLKRQREFDEFFSDEETVARIKEESIIYWRQFFEDEIDDKYLERRRSIGETHARIGVPLSIYFAAMNQMNIIFHDHMKSDTKNQKEIGECLKSIMKLNHFDTAVVVEAYGDMISARIASSTKAIMEMSTPVTQIWDGVLFLPIVGLIDSKRAQDIMDAALEKIAQSRAIAFIMDISGVGVVDTAVANYLIKVTKATRLMGCECTISGVSPSIAQTIVDLGIDVGSVRTTATMQDALARAFRILGEARRGSQRLGDDRENT